MENDLLKEMSKKQTTDNELYKSKLGLLSKRPNFLLNLCSDEELENVFDFLRKTLDSGIYIQEINDYSYDFRTRMKELGILSWDIGTTQTFNLKPNSQNGIKLGNCYLKVINKQTTPINMVWSGYLLTKDGNEIKEKLNIITDYNVVLKFAKKLKLDNRNLEILLFNIILNDMGKLKLGEEIKID